MELFEVGMFERSAEKRGCGDKVLGSPGGEREVGQGWGQMREEWRELQGSCE